MSSPAPPGNGPAQTPGSPAANPISAARTAASAAANPASLITGNLGSATDAVLRTKRDETGQAASAKDSVKGIASGAVQGAATGGWAGAAKGAAFAAVGDKRVRRWAVLAIALPLAFVLVLPLAFAGLSVMMLGSFGGGDTARSNEAASQSGYGEEDVVNAASAGNALGLPWEIVLAWRSATDDELDGFRLRMLLRPGTSLGAGAVYQDGQGRIEGKSDSNIAAFEAERDAWVAALIGVGLDESQAQSVYAQAREWRLGATEQCRADGSASPETEGEDSGKVEFATSDGTRTLDQTQIKNLRAILAAAKKVKGADTDALIIMVMAALVESNLYNYANKNVPESMELPHDRVGSDHDSVGFFQMRASWGSAAERLDVDYQVRAFLGGPNGPNKGSPPGLFDHKGWQSMTKGEAAQDVEVSAYPDRYAKQEDFATRLVQRYGGASVANCGNSILAGYVGHPLGDPTWTVNEGYGWRDWGNRMHWGVDFFGGSAWCDYPIFSIADGTVVSAGEAGAFGNLVVIKHNDGTLSRYAHQPYHAESLWPKPGEKVIAGQLIGLIGTTGRSTGCHLHFEILVGGKQVDPIPVLEAAGVEIQWWRGGGMFPPNPKWGAGPPKNAKKYEGPL